MDIQNGGSDRTRRESFFKKDGYDLAKSLVYQRGFGKFMIPMAGQIPIPRIGQMLKSAIHDYALDILQIEQEAVALLVKRALSDLSLPIVVDFHGIWAEELAWAGVFRAHSFPYRFLQQNTTRMLRRINGVIVMNQYMRDYVMRNYHINPERIETVDMAAFDSADIVAPRAENPRVVYAGQVSHEKWSELFIESIPHIVKKYPNAEFFITARGDLLEKLGKTTKASKAKVNLFWFESKQEVAKLVSSCNVGVLTLAQNESYRISPASKFFEYATAGVPIVANDVGGWISIVRQKGVGILSANTPEAMAEAVMRFFAEPKLSLEYGERALTLVKNEFNIKSTAVLLDSFYKKVVAM